MLAQIFWHGFTIGEVSCPTKYFAEASSINLQRSIKYGFGPPGHRLEIPIRPVGHRQPKLFPARARGTPSGNEPGHPGNTVDTRERRERAGSLGAVRGDGVAALLAVRRGPMHACWT